MNATKTVTTVKTIEPAIPSRRKRVNPDKLSHILKPTVIRKPRNANL